MPTYPTPEPVTVAVTMKAGDVRVVASDRADTVVSVDPARWHPRAPGRRPVRMPERSAR